MLWIRLAVLCVMVGLLHSVAVVAQASSNRLAATSGSGTERVLNAPYSTRRRFTSIKKLANGKLDRTESGGSEARDSQGRTYSAGERQWTYLEGKKSVLKSEMLYRIEDPVANTTTKWDSSSKIVKVIHWPPITTKESNSFAQSEAAWDNAMASAFGEPEKLGTKTLEGVVVEGTRSSYTVPVGRDHHDQPIVVTHEIWYSPELKIVVLETNDDPRRSTTKNAFVNIGRGEPNVRPYQPPSDYIVRKVQMPD